MIRRTAGGIMRPTLAIAIFQFLLLVSAAPASAVEPEPRDQELDRLWSAVRDLEADHEQRVTLDGYYDFEYLADDSSRAGPSTFRQHHLSLFVGATRGPWRMLSEIEFEDGAELEGDGTTASGAGAINVERVWLEHTFSDALTLRAGKFLLPEYWNVNHFPNIVLSTNRPLMVREVFPADTTGVMAYGNGYEGPVGATWNLYVGNGQTETARDDNENKAVGGHLTVHLGDLLAAFARLDVGAGLHSERTGTGAASDAFDAWGADMQLNVMAVEVLFEYAYRNADAEREGLYVQPSVRVAERVRVFYRYDRLDTGTDLHTRHTAGVNFQPRHDVSLKLEVNQNAFEDPALDDCRQVAGSVSVYF